MKIFVWFRILSIVGLVALFEITPVGASALPASPCTLEWEPNSDSGVAGYALYYGLKDSGVTNRMDAGTAQTITVYNLLTSSNYFFFVVAYNAFGIESPSSNVVSYSPPTLSHLSINKLPDGTMSIQFRASPGVACHVEYASTPAASQWTTLGSATADSKGDVTINDPPAGRSSSRFYRGAQP
jgi:hypothetical protein